MKTQLVLLFGLVFLLFGCEDEEMDFSLCEDNPIENVTWIRDLVKEQDLIDTINTLEIVQYNYEGNTVFSVDKCPYNCSDSLINVYDCDQNLICEFGGITGLNTCPDFATKAINQGVVFSNASQIDTPEIQIEKITFQNSFGECIGFCTQTIEIENKKIVFISEYNLGELEPIRCERDLTDEEWEELQNDLDIDQFLRLDDVFGCPDCADGGASFIEIKFANAETKKVTFEFKNPPSIMEEYAEMLQTLLDGANCEEEEKEPVEEVCDKAVVVSKDVFKTKIATSIEKAEIMGNCLIISYKISDGDAFFEPILIDSGDIAESLPAQRILKFHYLPHSDAFHIPFETTTSFDISELATYDEPEVILNIEGYDEKITFIRRPQCGDPNINCILSQEMELKRIEQKFEELNIISSITTCESSSEIIATPVGSKSCGGPQLYLPYTSSINVNEFLNKIETYTNAEEAFNMKWGIPSTCEITSVPIYECVDGKPVKL